MQGRQVAWYRVALALTVAAAALFLLRMHNANGAEPQSESITAGRRLAEAWCMECHTIGAVAAGAKRVPPDFAAIANRPSTTALSLKVFLQTSHPTMPNIIIGPGQADDLVDYILSLKYR
ncbi:MULTISPECIES: cytochrome c [Bradyrhizobium]|uniref:Cytochrome c n=1 Tax=Bradyrhizobium elkanii TaxID=29448 RepID=A0A4U6RJ46_BRAEL|nr:MULTISPECIES: cytochrome c [Bradyrhizobium]MTV17776.1 cytochrome c [Bradyrhizobium sp. BR2003]TKV73718.1 cytochrome c [Bradyrhizobium elkanii]